MKKAIVTGANGFVGRYLVCELVKKGYYVWSIIRNEEEDISCIADYNTHIIYCDLADIKFLANKLPAGEYECFYHLAWAGSSGNARMDYSLQFKNSIASVDACQVAADLRCKRFVGAGSVTELMYGKYLQQDGSEPDLVTCYAVGKIAAEYMSKCVCTNRNIDFLWGYIANFYGVGDLSQNFINFLVKNYLEKNTPELTEGEQKADFIYVSDVARALIAMGEHGNKNSAYYIGYGKPRPLSEFVEIIRDMVNPILETGLGRKSFQGLDIDFDSIDTRKLKRDTGFEPQVSFEDGIKMTISWIRDNR